MKKSRVVHSKFFLAATCPESQWLQFLSAQIRMVVSHCIVEDRLHIAHELEKHGQKLAAGAIRATLKDRKKERVA
jgi:hypothetical protein